MSMGDPCICGDTESWHPECYQKQAEEAAAAHDAQIRADGYREGVEWALMEARGIAADPMTQRENTLCFWRRKWSVTSNHSHQLPPRHAWRQNESQAILATPPGIIADCSRADASIISLSCSGLYGAAAMGSQGIRGQAI